MMLQMTCVGRGVLPGQVMQWNKILLR